MPLSRKQLAVLAQVQLVGMHYYPGVSALLAGDGAPTKVHLAARKLVRGGFVVVDDQGVWRISAAGAAELEQSPDHVADVRVAESLRQGDAIVTKISRRRPSKQRPVDDEARVLAEVTEALRRNGSIQVDVADITMNPREWRRIARAAARSLGRQVQTFSARDQVVAVLKDWPATPEEERDQAQRLRAAVNAASGTVPEGDIAEYAGVSIGTFYRYFDDRIQVLDHIWPNRQDIYLTPDTPPESEVGTCQLPDVN